MCPHLPAHFKLSCEGLRTFHVQRLTVSGHRIEAGPSSFANYSALQRQSSPAALADHCAIIIQMTQSSQPSTHSDSLKPCPLTTCRHSSLLAANEGPVSMAVSVQSQRPFADHLPANLPSAVKCIYFCSSSNSSNKSYANFAFEVGGWTVANH